MSKASGETAKSPVLCCNNCGKSVHLEFISKGNQESKNSVNCPSCNQGLLSQIPGNNDSLQKGSGASETDADLDANGMPKPAKGLIDALSRFFTPTSNRRSKAPINPKSVSPSLARKEPVAVAEPSPVVASPPTKAAVVKKYTKSKQKPVTKLERSVKMTQVDAKKVAEVVKESAAKCATTVLAPVSRRKSASPVKIKPSSPSPKICKPTKKTVSVPTVSPVAQIPVSPVKSPKTSPSTPAASTNEVNGKKETLSSAGNESATTKTPKKTEQEKVLQPKAPKNAPLQSGELSDDNDDWSDVESQNEERKAVILAGITLPEQVTATDFDIFKKSQVKANEMMGISNREDHENHPQAIEFGKYEIQTWCSSAYPQEYARLKKLYLCEFCLKYIKSKTILERHLYKCQLRYPPGTEIYRSKNRSVFEVGGNTNKIYCQNLCLLAKLFLDHKTLYYDVEPFVFYVLTKNDQYGCHLIGYFSKENLFQQEYNVSCIMTLPQYQRQGYGRFLIAFSYLLSQMEGQLGTPEKPLSELGRVSYHAYWKSCVLEYLHRVGKVPSLTIDEISQTTGMCSQDIATALQLLNFVKRMPDPDKGPKTYKLAISVDWKLVESHAARVAASSTRISLDKEALRWPPLVSTHFGSNDDDHNSSGSADQNESTDVAKTASSIRKIPVAAAVSSPDKRVTDVVKSPDKSKRKKRKIEKIAIKEEKEQKRQAKTKATADKNDRKSQAKKESEANLVVA